MAPDVVKPLIDAVVPQLLLPIIPTPPLTPPPTPILPPPPPPLPPVPPMPPYVCCAFVSETPGTRVATDDGG